MRTLACLLFLGYLALATALTCSEHQLTASAVELPGSFTPRCDDDGTYSAFQCQGSVCHCATEEGKQIAGYDSHIAEVHLKLCTCARDEYAYQQLHLLGLTYNCADNGNYAAVQCVGSVCHCATEAGEHIGYESNIWELEGKLCTCARDEHAFQQTGMVGLSHNCADNGNYAAIQCVGTQCHCANTNGAQVSDSVHVSEVDQLSC